MKNNAIVRIVIWSIVLLVLSGTLTGLILDERYLSDYTPAAAMFAVPQETVTGVPPVQVLANEKALTFSPDVREIEINWVAGDIIITEKDVEEITVSESDVTDERYALQYQLRGTKLEILFSEESLMDGFGISLAGDLRKDLYIEVPKNWNGNSIEIDAASTNIEMHNITLRELDIDGASGTCDFQNCTIGELDVDAASGDIYYLGNLDRLDLDGASASFTADLQNTPSRIDMDSMDGKLDIALPEDCGFTVTMEGLNTSLSSDFHGTEMKNKSHVYGDGRCRINVDGMSCTVNIRKLDTVLTPVDPTAETAAPCTDPDCTDPGCPEHHHPDDCTDPDCSQHHTEQNCTDPNCSQHHTEQNCTDQNCTVHHPKSTHNDQHGNDHGSGHH